MNPERPYDQPTQRLDRDGPQAGRPVDPWQEEPAYGRDGRERRPPPRRSAPPRRGRDFAFGAVGLLLGFVLAFLVVALGTSDAPTDDPQLAAAQERIAALEAELAERDTQLAELQTRLAEAEAAAGDRAEDVQAQRQALDERAAVLDERARILEEREAAAERREAELAEREAAAQQPGDAEIPAIDDETAQTIIDQVIEQIRELFQGGGS